MDQPCDNGSAGQWRIESRTLPYYGPMVVDKGHLNRPSPLSTGALILIQPSPHRVTFKNSSPFPQGHLYRVTPLPMGSLIQTKSPPHRVTYTDQAPSPWVRNDMEILSSIDLLLSFLSPVAMPPDLYFVQVKIDSEPVTEKWLCDKENPKCRFTTEFVQTPSITSIEPRSGLPGSLVTLCGRIITAVYSGDQTDSDTMIRRVYVGTGTCEILSDKKKGQLYGLQMTADASEKQGCITCKIQDYFVGNLEASIIVSGEYGRSLPDHKLWYGRSNEKLSMFQTYPEITSVSPKTGSMVGGTELSVHGQFFNEFQGNLKVYIAGTECELTAPVEGDLIRCRTASTPQSSSSSHYTGNRGVLWENWSMAASHLDSIVDLTVQDTGYTKSTIDETSFLSLWSSPVSRMSGFILPPHDGEYELHIRAEGQAKLLFSIDGPPEHKTEVASSSNEVQFWQNDDQHSERLTLLQGESYYIEVLHQADHAGSAAQVALRDFGTKFTEAESGNSKPDVQIIKFSAAVEYEKQTISFETSGTGEVVFETQVVTVTSSYGPDSLSHYRIGLFSVYTGALTMKSSKEDLKRELEGLASLWPIQVLVVDKAVEGGTAFTITFQSEKGDFPDIHPLTEFSDLTIAVNEKIKGVPSGLVVSVGMAGVPSPVLSIDCTEEQMKSALETLFSTRCPVPILKPPASITAFEEYYESSDTFINGEAYCGRGSARNPESIYKKSSTSMGLPVAQNQKLCLAYLGYVKSELVLSYQYVSGSDFVQQKSTFPCPQLMSYSSWRYICVDMLDMLPSEQKGAYLSEVKLNRINWDTDFYVDNVFIGREETIQDRENLELRRRQPPRPNNVIVKSVTVTKSSATKYEVTVAAFNCGHGLPLFELAFGEGMVGSAADDDTAIYTLKNALNFEVMMRVDRVTHASLPVSGMLDIQYKTRLIRQIPVEITASSLRSLLKYNMGTGEVDVENSGECHNLQWKITFTGSPGDQPIWMILSWVRGTTVKVHNEYDGCMWYDPIPGDLLRTTHTEPQVIVLMAGIPSKCSGSCSFEWSQDGIPNLIGISPNSGSSYRHTEVVITGDGFGEEEDNISVVIGEVPCQVTSVKVTEIKCLVGDSTLGIYDVQVLIQGKGRSLQPNPQLSFQYIADITQITPSTGKTAGGESLTVSGHGFGSDATVEVGGQKCPFVSRSSSNIVCELPPATTVSVVVVQGGVQVSTLSDFTYITGPSPVINNVLPDTVSVEGGMVLTIEGSGFGESCDDCVLIETLAVTINLYTDTRVEVHLPPMAPAKYSVKLYVDGILIFQRNKKVPEIECVLTLRKIRPIGGSLFGGTKLTLTGEGFSKDVYNIEVSVGGTDCEVHSATTTEVICTLSWNGKLHHVNNQGTHPEHGIGYQWNPESLTIAEGDTIQWQWTTPSEVTDITVMVQETLGTNFEVFPEDGFSNGGWKSPNGEYSHMFPVPGEYNYWSGYVDTNHQIHYEGFVKVVPAESRTEKVILRVAGYEAQHDPSDKGLVEDGSHGDSYDCEPVEFPIPDCTDPDLPAVEDSEIYFKFSPCATPKITFIDKLHGTVGDNLTFTGSGFFGEACNINVTVGPNECVVESSSDISESSLTCRIDTIKPDDIFIWQKISLHVSNLGNALPFIKGLEDRMFTPLLIVMGMSPLSGSTLGGTQLTIDGSGFQDKHNTVVMLDNFLKCEIETITFQKIICSTPPSLDISREVSVTVIGDKSQFVAECRLPFCIFTYSIESTPVISDIQPESVSGSGTTLTVKGQLFGSEMLDVSVTVGGQSCELQSVIDEKIVCVIGFVPVGSYEPIVVIGKKGKAEASGFEFQSPPIISDLNPPEGSTNGGTKVIIAGNGFMKGSTSVTMDRGECTIISVTGDQIQCSTQPHGAARVTVIVKSNTIVYPQQTFTFSETRTPSIQSASLDEGLIMIEGSNFGVEEVDNTVVVGGNDCSIISASVARIVCEVVDLVTGTHPVCIDVAGKGRSNCDATVTRGFVLSSVEPASGSVAGGQIVTLSGSGLNAAAMTVTICDQTCEIVEDSEQIPSAIIIITSPSTGTGTKVCDVVVSAGGISEVLTDAYTYNIDKTAVVTGASPNKGGSAGGTELTIMGSGFGTRESEVTVTIAGVECIVQSVKEDGITCLTASSSSTGEFDILIKIKENGLASHAGSPDRFRYVDLWSSLYSWGGTDLPVSGDMVVVPTTTTLVLDIDTPALKLLLIQGGSLIFDDNDDVELKADNILITDSGLLQAGTEAEPFKHKAVITLMGQLHSKELPLYGTKSLAVRDGTLDLHGSDTSISWTHLHQTAVKGSSMVELQEAVDWGVGSEIVIASTGLQGFLENEKHRIAEISIDRKTLVLEQPLQFDHLGISTNLGGKEVDFKAEVGLLTHNIVVRGSIDAQWQDDIQACPEGFNPGEFAVQTCFSGRFGQEQGSDQFGAQIVILPAEPDKNLVVVRLSNVEVVNAGQAFRLGRHPVSFSAGGDMTGSYLKSSSIHHSYSRAVSIHGSNNIVIEDMVVYDIMGAAFTVEDGTETGNSFLQNLVIFVHPSTSLLNVDITPPAFWITNPNNVYNRNAVSGSTHYGFWYNLGKSAQNSNDCSKHVPLAEFMGNTAHSLGRYGLLISGTYSPTGGTCERGQAEVGVFHSFSAWFCEKGVEANKIGAVQFQECVLVSNVQAGIEVKEVSASPSYDQNSPKLVDSLIVGHTPLLSSNPTCTLAGVLLPFKNGFSVEGVHFVNFNTDECSCFKVTRIPATCTQFCGGFLYKVSSLSFTQVNYKLLLEWEFEAVIEDMDGSLTGTPGGKLIPSTPTLPSACSVFSSSPGIEISLCPSNINFHRFSFNNISPKSLKFKMAIFSNQYGESSVPFREKRTTHPNGWMVVLVDGEVYSMSMENGQHLTNISYTGVFYDFHEGDYVIINQLVRQKPDRFMIDGSTNIESHEGELDPLTHFNGDWVYVRDDSTNGTIHYLASERINAWTKPSVYHQDRDFNFNAHRCFFRDCIVPPDPTSIPPSPLRPVDYYRWSETDTWANMPDGWGGNKGNGVYGLPVDGDNVIIPQDMWIIADTRIPWLGKLLVYGYLELEDEDEESGTIRDFEVHATYIYIRRGRLIIGWPDRPFRGQVLISLQGSHETPDYPVIDGPNVGSAGIGVFGGLDIHGLSKVVQWIRLWETAEAGDSSLTLAGEVDWFIGEEVVVAPTGYRAWHTETFSITAIDKVDEKTVLQLNGTLAHRHLAYTENLPGGDVVTMAAEVGVLTRNIKVMGKDYDDMFRQSFGARIVVGISSHDGKPAIGYARLSNVEFYHTGQEGWTMDYDPRFSVVFVYTGDVSPIRPSYITGCTFHNGFSTAIGVFGTHGLVMSHNVIHHTVGPAIIAKFVKTITINHNLVTLTIWTGSYQDRNESENVLYYGSVEMIGVENLMMEGNAVAGSERVAFHVGGQSCNTQNSQRWKDNVGHSSLIGVALFPDDGLTAKCRMLAGFTIWKCLDYGIYYNAQPSGFVTGVKLVENGVGIFPMIIGPKAVSHETANKEFTVENCAIVGRTSSFVCNGDTADPEDHNIKYSHQGRCWSVKGGKVGISWPSFTSNSNGAPVRSFNGIKSYPAIRGIMTLREVTFANFGSACDGEDYVITTNPGNNDGMHPIQVEQITTSHVSETNKVFIHRPDVNLVNPSDCGDMDCDGMKTALLTDDDGSFLGNPGAVIPHAEFEWGGDPRRGLGDYRIPKQLITSLSGERLDVDTVAPYKGIIGNRDCALFEEWQAYLCTELMYRMLLIESLDSDTETRRLSPVAVLGDQYLNLINGPQDHGWCMGHACGKRLSTFMTIVALNKMYDIYFTSTTPQKLAFHLLNVEAEQAILLRLKLSSPHRYNVYYEGVLVKPKQEETQSGDGKVPRELLLDLSDKVGSNCIDFQQNMLHFVLRSSVSDQPIIVQQSQTIVIEFHMPPMTIEDFFGQNFVTNIAKFLGVPSSKIKFATPVNEREWQNRRKRSTDLTTIVAEIGDEPAQFLNESVSGGMNFSSLNSMAISLINEAQLGNLSDLLNATIIDVSISEPVPHLSDQEWAYISTINGYGELVEYKKVNRISFHTMPLVLYENVLFLVQPKINVLDDNELPITMLGSHTTTWAVEATLQGSNDSLLGGTKVKELQNGQANFTDLYVRHAGSYILEFHISSPLRGEKYTLTKELVVPHRPILLSLVERTDNNGIFLGSSPRLVFALTDAQSQDVIQDINWRGHDWTVTAEPVVQSCYVGSLEGTKQVTFDMTSGQAVLDNIKFTRPGLYYVKFSLKSDPIEYSSEQELEFYVPQTYPDNFTVEEKNTVTLKFEGDYDEIVADHVKIFKSVIVGYFLNSNASLFAFLDNFSVSRGSILVEFTMEGTKWGMNQSRLVLCGMVEDNPHLDYDGYNVSLSPFMNIDEEAYYGVMCGPLAESEDSDYLVLIICVTVAMVCFIAVLIFIFIWRCTVRPKTGPTEIFLMIKSSKQYPAFFSTELRHPSNL
ncbi:hypothetical protein ScPMuIL_002490 [Solemya velum]